jgi:hypothetical protein
MKSRPQKTKKLADFHSGIPGSPFFGLTIGGVGTPYFASHPDPPDLKKTGLVSMTHPARDSSGKHEARTWDPSISGPARGTRGAANEDAKYVSGCRTPMERQAVERWTIFLTLQGNQIENIFSCRNLV